MEFDTCSLTGSILNPLVGKFPKDTQKEEKNHEKEGRYMIIRPKLHASEHGVAM